MQGHRLSQSASVDISSLLQLPQYYWNNWDQWMADGLQAAEGENGLDHLALSNATDSVWSVPLDTMPVDSTGGTLHQHHEVPSSAEAQGQAAVTAALLRYMLEGTQDKV
jgi:hypothetical protein